MDEMTPQHGRRYEASIRHKSRLSHLKRTQEGDNWANIGAQGQRKIVHDRRDNSETWMAASKTMAEVDVVGDKQENCCSFERGCGYGTRDCWCMRAHECPRSDLLPMIECSKRQSTNQENPELLLTDSACSLNYPNWGVSVDDSASVR